MLSIKKTFAALFATALLGVGIAAPASAGHQNGLVNVSVGNVKILNHVKAGVAANVAAQICGVNVGPVLILARDTGNTGTRHTVCKVDGQAVRFTQAG